MIRHSEVSYALSRMLSFFWWLEWWSLSQITYTKFHGCAQPMTKTMVWRRKWKIEYRVVGILSRRHLWVRGYYLQADLLYINGDSYMFLMKSVTYPTYEEGAWLIKGSTFREINDVALLERSFLCHVIEDNIMLYVKTYLLF